MLRPIETVVPAQPALAPARATVQDLGGGAFVIRSPEPLASYARCVGEWLENWAACTFEALALALAERDPSGN